MANTSFIDIEELSPTHHYLSEKKLAEVKKHFATHSLEDYPPVSVMKFGGKTLITHGHHFAYYISTQGKYIAKVQDDGSSPFFLSLKLKKECEKKKVLTVKDLKKRILPPADYAGKWMKYYEDALQKTSDSPLSGLKREEMAGKDEKLKTANFILTPIPEYFANEFIYKNYMEKVRDMQFTSFNVYGHPIAFAALRPVYENVLEIYMLGIHERADMPELSGRIMKEILKTKKALGKGFVTVKVPLKSAVHNKAHRLYDFYLGHGFTHIENIESPWDEKRLCTLFLRG
jgi:hypothetical protein